MDIVSCFYKAVAAICLPMFLANLAGADQAVQLALGMFGLAICLIWQVARWTPKP